MTLTSRASYPRMHPFKVHQGLSPQLLMSRRGSKRVALPLAPVRQPRGRNHAVFFLAIGQTGRLNKIGRELTRAKLNRTRGVLRSAHVGKRGPIASRTVAIRP
jgi:hypothetical protein